MIDTIYSDPNYLKHYGVKGMKWGVRKEESGFVTKRKARKEKEAELKTLYKRYGDIEDKITYGKHGNSSNKIAKENEKYRNELENLDKRINELTAKPSLSDKFNAKKERLAKQSYKPYGIKNLPVAGRLRDQAKLTKAYSESTYASDIKNAKGFKKKYSAAKAYVDNRPIVVGGITGTTVIKGKQYSDMVLRGVFRKDKSYDIWY